MKNVVCIILFIVTSSLYFSCKKNDPCGEGDPAQTQFTFMLVDSFDNNLVFGDKKRYNPDSIRIIYHSNTRSSFGYRSDSPEPYFELFIGYPKISDSIEVILKLDSINSDTLSFNNLHNYCGTIIKYDVKLNGKVLCKQWDMSNTKKIVK